MLVFTRKPLADTNVNQTQDLQTAYASDVIFFAVPIHVFDEVIAEHKTYIHEGHLLIDVLSVKLHAKEVFEKYFKTEKVQTLLTHPMFGPDSSKDGFDGLPIVLDRATSSDQTYAFWKSFFARKGLTVIEITADQHDKLAANSQGLTHFIGRLLDEMDVEKTAIDTLGAKKLLEVREQTCNDTWDLFVNLQQYNPYTEDMRMQLGIAYDKLYTKLRPKQTTPSKTTIGIQGGRGSFNEEAVLTYLQHNKISNCHIKHLHTTENVLRELQEGTIEQGQFAVHNTLGGIVHESIRAMGKYSYTLIGDYTLQIEHALMIHPDAKMADVDTIMAHPQVFAQCETKLAEKYKHLVQVVGEGELVDHAKVAQHLSEKKLPANVAVMGSRVLAQVYGLKIVEEGLQDKKDNFTTFLLVKK